MLFHGMFQRRGRSVSWAPRACRRDLSPWRPSGPRQEHGHIEAFLRPDCRCNGGDTWRPKMPSGKENARILCDFLLKQSNESSEYNFAPSVCNGASRVIGVRLHCNFAVVGRRPTGLSRAICLIGP